ncbi:hypothetical protein G9A89_014535 [Geosiphon pyriformis]|nr:hypothetical protein G9A89_014535 [Geosiphon pyriformis]
MENEKAETISDSVELSGNDYEKKRLENIKRNEEILRQLDLPGIANTLKPTLRAKMLKAKTKTREKPLVQPIRQSLRLRGVAPDSMEAKRKATELLEKAVEKRARKEGVFELDDVAAANTTPEKTIKLKMVLEELNTSDSSHLVDKLIESKSYDTSVEQLVSSDFVKEDQSIRSVRKNIKKLSLQPNWSSVKVTPGRIYCVALHPSSEKILASAGDKYGGLGLWDLQDKEIDEDGDILPATYNYNPHSRTISSMMYSPTNSNRLFTSSFDGSVRYLDLNLGKFSEAIVSNTNLYTSMDFEPKGNRFYASSIGGTVSVCDVREPGSSHIDYQMHGRKITCVSVNPISPNLIVTSSLDRTIRLWDIRALSIEDPQYLQECHEDKAISSVYWSPKGTQILATIWEDNINVLNYKSDTKKLTQHLRIEHNNNTGRWVTPFRARWNHNPLLHPHFLVGNMRRSVDVISAIDGELIWNLRDESITAIPAVNCFHPNLNMILGGNASGRMIVWSDHW